MKIFVTMEWQPLLVRMSNKKNISEKSHEKHRVSIQTWYEKIWHRNEALGYTINQIEWSDNGNTLQVAFWIDTSEFIASYFCNPPLDANSPQLRLPHIGNVYPSNKLIDVCVSSRK